MLDHRWFAARAGRQRRRMEEDLVADHARAEGRNLFGKWRRRRAGLGQVLITMPRTSDAAVDDLALAERPVLMTADVRHRGNAPIVFEDGDPLASARHDTRALLRDAFDVADGDVFVLANGRRAVD